MREHLYASTKIRLALQTYVFFKVANLMMAFVFQIVVVKILSPDHYATYAVLLATLIAGERMLSFGIDRTIMRFVPALTRWGDSAGLRALVVRIAMIRLCALLFLVVAMIGGMPALNDALPIRLDHTTSVAFAIWFVAYTLGNDADAFAQSWLAHFDAAVIGFLEVAARMAIILLVGRYLQEPDVKIVVVICAITSTISIAVLCVRLSRFAKLFGNPRVVESSEIEDRAFDPKRAPMFALANFASTVVYLVSSPAVIRIIATGGLDIIALAAFSFAQGLYMSLQRVFPGLLILPTLEPIVMSQPSVDGPSDQILAGLSLVYKLELICIFSALIATTIAGADIVTILSRSAYAQYHFILGILIGSLVLITSYRIFELIANMNFKQHVFFSLWPLGFVWMSAMYFTVESWGLVSVLLWPLIDILIRIAFLTFMFRKYSINRVFDLDRTLRIALCTCTIIVALLLSRLFMMPDWPLVELVRAAIGLAIFVGSLFVIKPFRPSEYESLASAVPSTWGVVRALARATSSP